MRLIVVARLVVGAACLTAPGPLLRAVRAPDHADLRVRGVARVLGLRLVTQGALDAAWPGYPRRLGVAVELTHAASMVPVAALRPDHRRAATTSASVATALALLDLAEGAG
jgi:hypothetical protein